MSSHKEELDGALQFFEGEDVVVTTKLRGILTIASIIRGDHKHDHLPQWKLTTANGYRIWNHPITDWLNKRFVIADFVGLLLLGILWREQSGEALLTGDDLERIINPRQDDDIYETTFSVIDISIMRQEGYYERLYEVERLLPDEREIVRPIIFVRIKSDQIGQMWDSTIENGYKGIVIRSIEKHWKQISCDSKLQIDMVVIGTKQENQVSCGLYYAGWLVVCDVDVPEEIYNVLLKDNTSIEIAGISMFTIKRTITVEVDNLEKSTAKPIINLMRDKIDKTVYFPDFENATFIEISNVPPLGCFGEELTKYFKKDIEAVTKPELKRFALL